MYHLNGHKNCRLNCYLSLLGKLKQSSFPGLWAGKLNDPGIDLLPGFGRYDINSIRTLILSTLKGFYLSTLRFWPEAAEVGVAAVPVVAGAELAGIVGEVDITFDFLRKLALSLFPSFDHSF